MQYEFILKSQLVEGDHVDMLLERLGGSACHDALVGVGRAGYVVLFFSRESSSAFGAVESAVADVREVLPGARLVVARTDSTGYHSSHVRN